MCSSGLLQCVSRVFRVIFFFFIEELMDRKTSLSALEQRTSPTFPGEFPSRIHSHVYVIFTWELELCLVVRAGSLNLSGREGSCSSTLSSRLLHKTDGRITALQLFKHHNDLQLIPERTSRVTLVLFTSSKSLFCSIRKGASAVGWKEAANTLLLPMFHVS